MKKSLAMLLALIMVLSLCACGSGKAGTDSKLSAAEETITSVADATITNDDFIGTWERDFVSSENEHLKTTLEIYKGGTGHLNTFHYDGSRDNNFDGTWEVKDDVMNFSYLGSSRGYEIDKSSTPFSLIRVDDNEVVFYKVK